MHRSGRTGRAGRTGKSILLYSEREGWDVRNLERRANVQFVRAGPPSVATVMDSAAGLVSRRLATVEESVTHSARSLCIPSHPILFYSSHSTPLVESPSLTEGPHSFACLRL